MVNLVYDGRYLRAIKRCSKDPVTGKRKDFERECEALRKCEAMSIVRMISHSTDGAPELELEFVPGGSLGKWLDHSNVYEYLTPTRLHIIFYGVARAIKEIHDADLVHRDIKPDNVLLTHAFEPKLCDFGFARVLANESLSYVGTEFYVAPEILSNESYTAAVDLFSFGRLIYTVLTRDCEKGTEPMDDGPYKDMVEALTQNDPKQRMSIEEAIEALEHLERFPGVDPAAFADYRRRYEECEYEEWCTPGFLERHQDDNPTLCFFLGILYHEGVGVDKDEERAESLFLKAGDQGDLKAAAIYASVSKNAIPQRWTKVFNPSQLEFIKGEY